MADSKTPQRPLSPHLQVYRWPITMTMSILHRVTGGALYVGTVLVAAWLAAAASGPEAFGTAQWLARSPLGLLVLFGYTWALIHHMLGGIRHFIWDLCYALEPGIRNTIAWANLFGSVILTLLVWGVGLWLARGAG